MSEYLAEGTYNSSASLDTKLSVKVVWEKLH